MGVVARILTGCLVLIVHQQIFCTQAINTEDFASGKVSIVEYAHTNPLSRQELKKQKKEEKLLHRAEIFMLRFEKVIHSKMQKKSIGSISDPVDRWLWIWGISWGLGILITLFAGGAVTSAAIGILWLFAFALGSVSLIIWLIKSLG